MARPKKITPPELKSGEAITTLLVMSDFKVIIKELISMIPKEKKTGKKWNAILDAIKGL